MEWNLLSLLIIVTLELISGIHVDQPRQASRQGRFFGFQKLLKSTNTKKPFLQNRIQELMDKLSSFENISAQLDDIDGIISLITFFKHKACPPATNSFPIGSKCYQHVQDLWMSYDDALSFCQSRGGQLMRPDLTDPYFYPSLQKIFPTVGENSLLVGVTDIFNEGTFTFLDGTELPPGTVQQKSHRQGKERDCVSLSSRNGFTLRDVVCSFRHQFICEYNFVDLLGSLI